MRDAAVSSASLSETPRSLSKPSFVQASLDGDGAYCVLVEHNERALVRGAYPSEAQGASVLAQVQRVLQDVEEKALRGERAVSEAP